MSGEVPISRRALSLAQRQEQELGLAFPWRPHQHPSPAALRDSPGSRLSQVPSLDRAARAPSARSADRISEAPCRAASTTAFEPDRVCASFRRKDSASRLPPPAARETASSHPVDHLVPWDRIEPLQERPEASGARRKALQLVHAPPTGPVDADGDACTPGTISSPPPGCLRVAFGAS
jgi:hypothetical protein